MSNDDDDDDAEPELEPEPEPEHGSLDIRQKSAEMSTGAKTFKGNHKKWARELRHSK